MAIHRQLSPMLLLSVLVLAGCDASLDPYTAENRHFSIFGYLDATEDVHWVRIEALKDNVAIGADSTLNATATLTHLPSGQEVAFSDSLFRFNERFLCESRSSAQGYVPLRRS